MPLIYNSVEFDVNDRLLLTIEPDVDLVVSRPEYVVFSVPSTWGRTDTFDMTNSGFLVNNDRIFPSKIEVLGPRDAGVRMDDLINNPDIEDVSEAADVVLIHPQGLAVRINVLEVDTEDKVITSRVLGWEFYLDTWTLIGATDGRARD